MSKQVSRMQSEEVLRCGTPSDLYMLVPIGHRSAVRRFARCFGLDREDLARTELETKLGRSIISPAKASDYLKGDEPPKEIE